MIETNGESFDGDRVMGVHGYIQTKLLWICPLFILIAYRMIYVLFFYYSFSSHKRVS